MATHLVARVDSKPVYVSVLLLLTLRMTASLRHPVCGVCSVRRFMLKAVPFSGFHSPFLPLSLLFFSCKFYSDLVMCLFNVLKLSLGLSVQVVCLFVQQPAVLAKQLLAEIPRQVFEYYSINGIQPGAGVQRK